MTTQRIIFCLPHIVMGGLEKVLCEYLLELKKDHEFDLCVISKKRVIDSFFIDFFKSNDIKLVDDIWYNKPKVHFFLFKWFINIYAKLKKYKFFRFFNSFDIYIDFANFAYRDELKKIAKPKLAWCHGSINFFDNFIKNKEELDIYDKIICLSENFKRDFIKKYPFLSDRIVFIYNPIDIKAVKVGAMNELYKTKGKYFVAVQRLDSDKKVETIIDAFNKFSIKHKDFNLYIVGDGPLTAALKKRAGNNEKIIFTGRLDNAYAIIKKSDALILSSVEKIGEGLGNVLLEAQVLGTLTISSDVQSGPTEILLDGKAGYLFKAENSNSLLKVLEYVISHPEENTEKIKTATKFLYRFEAGQSAQVLREELRKLSK